MTARGSRRGGCIVSHRLLLSSPHAAAAKHIACISFSLPPSFPPFGLFGGSRLRLEPGADSGGEEKEEEGEGPLGGGMSGGGREEGTSTMTTGFAAGRGKGPFLSSLFPFSCTRLPGELEGGGSSSFRCFAAERGGENVRRRRDLQKKSQSPSHKNLSFVPWDEFIYLVD